MKLNIETYELRLLCDILNLRIISTSDDTFTIYYELIRSSDNYIAETGNKQIPIQYIGLFGQNPANIDNINLLLGSWGITASSVVGQEGG